MSYLSNCHNATLIVCNPFFKSLSETLDEYSESLDANENNSLVVYQSHSSLNYLHSVMR